MLGSGSAVAIALFLASAEQSKSLSWSTIAEQLQQLMPTWLWVVLSLSVVAFLVLIDIGDKLSGIFGSPFQRSQPSTDQLERTRQQLLGIVKKEVNRRLATSLHELVKLDLYMEDQRQRVGSPQYKLVPEDPPKDLEPSFQAVNRVLHQKGNKPPLDLKLTQKIFEVFERQDIAGKLLILGDPGSGKTTELLQMAKDLVARAEENAQHPVPVILELSSWNGEPIDKWVTSQLKKLYNLTEATTQQWLENNQILLLLDGLDELGLTKQRQCIEKINQFVEKTRTSELVVCCRREEYEAGQIELDELSGAVYLEALKEDQIRQYFEELNRLSLWKNISTNPTLLELAQKPLFLFMLVVAYQGNPIRNEQELFDAYIEKHLHEPGNQGTYKPGKEPATQQTCHYLVWLAKQLESIHETAFLIEQMQLRMLPQRQKWKYQLRDGLITGLLFGLISVLLNPILLPFTLLVPLFVLSSNSESKIEPVEILMWSWRRLINHVLHKGLIVGFESGVKAIGSDGCDKFLLPFFMLGSLFGLAYGALAGVHAWQYVGGIEGQIVGWIIGIIAGIIGVIIGAIITMLGVTLLSGLIFGLIGGAGGLISGLWVGLISESVELKARPNQGIKRSTINSLRAGLFFGLIFGLGIGLISGHFLGLSMGLIIGLRAGLFIGFLGGLNYGGRACIQHLSLRLTLYQANCIPWNYARFLEHAVKHRFIQRTGGRYRFVHDLLRKHFAAMPLTPRE